MQIRAKLTFTFLFSTALLLGFAFLLIYYFSLQSQRTDFREQLYKKAATTANLLIGVKEVDSTLLKIIDQNKRDIYSFENISIFDEKGKELYTNNDSLHFNQFVPTFRQNLKRLYEDSFIEFYANDIEIVGGILEFKGDKYAFMAGARDASGLLFLKSLKRTLIYVYLSILCITSFVGWIYAGRALKPINRLINEMNKISASNLSERLKSPGNKDEIARLINTFNGLLARLQQSFNDQRSFISYASHELKNPLASINTQIDVTLLNVRNSDEYMSTLQFIKEDIHRLKEITDQLLLLSKITTESEQSNQQDIRVDELVIEIKNHLQLKYPEAKINLIFTLPESERKLIIQGNKVLVRSAIDNLVENGIKYSTDNTVNIELSADQAPVVEISNVSDALDQDELTRIFEPFYRSRSSRSQKGYGLGLAIVKRISETNNYHLSAQLTGNTVRFTLKLN